MALFSELKTLIKQFFKTKPADISKFEIVTMKNFPFQGYKYLMWCGLIVQRPNIARMYRFEELDNNHESIHLHQAKDKGSWFKFYASYIWNWLKMHPLFTPRNGAYYLNIYEIEAYAKENDFTYLKTREKNNHKKFKIEKPIKTYKSFSSKTSFKNYIKEIFKNVH